jgi:protein-L-isoaspartate(D-aspartate) O-methyltransferase
MADPSNFVLVPDPDPNTEAPSRPIAPLLSHLPVLALTLTFMAVASLAIPRSGSGADYAVERAAMVRTIEARAREAEFAVPGGQIDPKVLEALRTVPRHEFVPATLQRDSYADHPLPIGYGQTISQPFIVALMTHVLDLGPNSVVLEVGTGSGYQAAVLAQVVRQVHTVELIPELAARATRVLAGLGYANISVRQADGYNGLPEAAPFNGIIVTAAAGHIPPPLLEQLKPGGRMVIPIGPPLGVQHLTVVERDAGGRIRTRRLFPVAFVPLNRPS